MKIKTTLKKLKRGDVVSIDWIGQALGHAFDSEVTRRYMRVRDDKMIEVFEKISNQG